jgi:hypothetical protein
VAPRKLKVICPCTGKACIHGCNVDDICPCGEKGPCSAGCKAVGYKSAFPQADGFSLPTDSTARKDIPLARGLLDYFPAALAEVAKLSKAGNDKHNPGEELHWARGKSMDHADCIMRHLVDRGTIDTDGITHSAKVAWRALALLQEELEAAGAPMSRGSKVAE